MRRLLFARLSACSIFLLIRKKPASAMSAWRSAENSDPLSWYLSETVVVWSKYLLHTAPQRHHNSHTLLPFTLEGQELPTWGLKLNAACECATIAHACDRIKFSTWWSVSSMPLRAECRGNQNGPFTYINLRLCVVIEVNAIWCSDAGDV